MLFILECSLLFREHMEEKDLIKKSDPGVMSTGKKGQQSHKENQSLATALINNTRNSGQYQRSGRRSGRQAQTHLNSVCGAGCKYHQGFSYQGAIRTKWGSTGKVVGVSQWTTSLHFKDRQMTPMTGLPPDVKHRPTITFTLKDHKFNVYMGYRSPFGQAFTIC